MANLNIEPLTLDHQALDAGQSRRMQRARRTAAWVALVAISVFVLSIVHAVWLRAHPQLHQQAELAVQEIMQ